MGDVRTIPLTPGSLSAAEWAPFGWLPADDTDPADATHSYEFTLGDPHVNVIALVGERGVDVAQDVLERLAVLSRNAGDLVDRAEVEPLRHRAVAGSLVLVVIWMVDLQPSHPSLGHRLEDVLDNGPNNPAPPPKRFAAVIQRPTTPHGSRFTALRP